MVVRPELVSKNDNGKVKTVNTATLSDVRLVVMIV